jgi:thiol-disulfide isomerase/thioredoxin
VIRHARIWIAGWALVATGCATMASSENDAKLPTAPVSLRIDRIDGGVLTLGSLRGRVVVVNVFTTWADLALFEVPKLKKIATTHDTKDIVVVGIALDQDKKMVSIFARTFEIPYYLGVVDDPAAFTSDNGPFGKITLIPTSILLDRDGHVVARMDGVWADGVLEAAVDRLVARGAGSH